MSYQLIKVQKNQYKIFGLVLSAFAIGFILYKIFLSHPNKKEQEKFNNDNVLNPPAFNNKSYNLGVCSKNCCATQWPVPINLTEKSNVNPKDIGNKYYRSNLTCNNGVINTGCVCLTKGSDKLLANRGYVNKLPMGNGLIDEDNRISAFKIMEDEVPRPLNVFGQTTELTGVPDEKFRTHGKVENKFDKKVDKFRSVESEEDMVRNFYMPIDTNVISFDNEAINDALLKSNISGNEITPETTETEKMLIKPIGFEDKDIIVDRK
jgi:hypothetical protein